MTIPAEFQIDLDRVVAALRAAGSKDIYLFGSLTSGTAGDESDIDLAVTGLPANRFFEIYSQVARSLTHELDLVDLDHEEEFATFLKRTNRLVRIA